MSQSNTVFYFRSQFSLDRPVRPLCASFYNLLCPPETGTVFETILFETKFAFSESVTSPILELSKNILKTLLNTVVQCSLTLEIIRNICSTR